jgi:hypothetical protein
MKKEVFYDDERKLLLLQQERLMAEIRDDFLSQNNDKFADFFLFVEISIDYTDG